MCETFRIPHSEFLGWDADDRHKAVMHQIRRSERCPSCGLHPDEAGHYEAHIVTCEGCETTAKGEKELEQKRSTGGFVVPPGTRVGLRRRRPPEPEGGGGG